MPFLRVPFLRVAFLFEQHRATRATRSEPIATFVTSEFHAGHMRIRPRSFLGAFFFKTRTGVKLILMRRLQLRKLYNTIGPAGLSALQLPIGWKVFVAELLDARRIAAVFIGVLGAH